MNLLALDPGHTTGFAYLRWQNETGVLAVSACGTFNTLTACWKLLHHYLPSLDGIVYESFHLYAHRANAQINSNFFTVQVIGVIKLFIELNDVPGYSQTAQFGKSLWTDPKLKKFDLYNPNRHVRDALRHGLMHLRVHEHERFASRWL